MKITKYRFLWKLLKITKNSHLEIFCRYMTTALPIEPIKTHFNHTWNRTLQTIDLVLLQNTTITKLKISHRFCNQHLQIKKITPRNCVFVSSKIVSVLVEMLLSLNMPCIIWLWNAQRFVCHFVELNQRYLG